MNDMPLKYRYEAENDYIQEQLATKQIRWRKPYDAKENAEMTLLTQTDMYGDEGLTQQAPAEEQDINVIMQRFGVKDGSVLPHWRAPADMFGDFSDMPSDPVEAQEMLRLGQMAFMKLPAAIRTRFTDGATLFNWLNDPANADEAVKLGLLRRLDQTPTVSSSTSSDKEPLVPPPTPTEGAK